VGRLAYQDGVGGERWVYPKRGQGYGAGEAGGKERFEKHPILKAIDGHRRQERAVSGTGGLHVACRDLALRMGRSQVGFEQLCEQ
jgi:hypothetical protein